MGFIVEICTSFFCLRALRLVMWTLIIRWQSGLYSNTVCEDDSTHTTYLHPRQGDASHSPIRFSVKACDCDLSRFQSPNRIVSVVELCYRGPAVDGARRHHGCLYTLYFLVRQSQIVTWTIPSFILEERFPCRICGYIEKPWDEDHEVSIVNPVAMWLKFSQGCSFSAVFRCF